MKHYYYFRKLFYFFFVSFFFLILPVLFRINYLNNSILATIIAEPIRVIRSSSRKFLITLLIFLVLNPVFSLSPFAVISGSFSNNRKILFSSPLLSPFLSPLAIFSFSFGEKNGKLTLIKCSEISKISLL